LFEKHTECVVILKRLVLAGGEKKKKAKVCHVRSKTWEEIKIFTHANALFFNTKKDSGFAQIFEIV